MKSNSVDWQSLLEQLTEDLKARSSDDAKGRPDNKAWRIIADFIYTYGHAMLRQAFPVLQRADIEDILQGVFVKLQSLRRMKMVKRSGSPKGYLFIMIRNAAIDYLRKMNRRLDTQGLEYTDDLARDYEMLINMEFSRRSREELIARLLATLTAEELELIRMRYYDGYSIGEIAKKKKVEYSAMAVRLYRLIKRLRQAVSKLK